MEQEQTQDIFKGIIYSELIDSEFKPKIWIPRSLSAEQTLKIVTKTTDYFSKEKEEIWDSRISMLPIPFYKFLELTYFFKRSTEIPDKTIIASLTILINENASDFFYRNIDRLRRDLEFLAEELKKTDDQRTILSRYYSNLIEFIERYLDFRSLAGVKERSEDIMTGGVLLTYFHNKLGPRTLYCYPENFLSEKQQKRLNKELEHSSEEGLFIKTYTQFNAIHLYFELKSKTARGQTEMCLISLILEEMPSKEMIDNISFRLLDLIDKLYLKPEVALGLQERQENMENFNIKITQMNEYLRNWVREVYRVCIEEYFKKSSEGEFARILMDSNRVKLLEKLSEGPLELEKLKIWVSNSLGKELDCMGLISPLIDSNFVVINEVSGINYVILLKGLRVYRFSPTNTLEKLKSFGSIYPEIYPDLLKQYTKEINYFFRKYRATMDETTLLSRIIFDPINYLIISKLRKGGIYLQTDFKEVLGENIYNLASRNLKFLKEHNIITEIKADNENFILLKTDIKFMKTIPKHVLLGKKKKEFLPDPLKKVSNDISESPDQIKNIFKRWFA